jgi:hypothetical protein
VFCRSVAFDEQCEPTTGSRTHPWLIPASRLGFSFQDLTHAGYSTRIDHFTSPGPPSVANRLSAGVLGVDH